MYNSLQPSGLQYARLTCSSLSPGVCSNSSPLSWWCHPTISSSVVLFSCLRSFPASGFFSSDSALHIRWPKYQRLSFSISPSNEYSRVISFRIDSFDLLAFQGILNSLPQHNSKASVLQHSAFFTVQLSHLYMTTGCVHVCPCVHAPTCHSCDFMDLCQQMSQLFNMLSRLVTAFLPRSKCLLISRLPSPFAEISEPKKIKSVTVSTVSPSICHGVMGPDAMILVIYTHKLRSQIALERWFS